MWRANNMSRLWRWWRVPGRHDVTQLAVSHEGALVASSTAGGLVRLFDPARGEWIADLHGHLNSAVSIAFSANGRRLISTSSGGREAVKIWDIGTRQELLTLDGTGSLLDNARLECRWTRDPRRPALAGLARAVLGGNRGSGESDGRKMQ